MREENQTLKSIGAQKIHEETHIPRAHIQAVIDENFEDLNRVQFLGFISIFQREYELDLTTLKESGLSFFDEKSINSRAKSGVFVVSDKPQKPKTIYFVLLVVFLLAVAFFSFDTGTTEEIHVVESSKNEIIEKVKDEIVAAEITEVNSTESNTTLIDINLTKTQDVNLSIDIVEELVEPRKELLAFKIKPKSRVWLGYIDVKTNKKYQDTTRKTLTLKRDKEWILVLGHSYVEFDVNGKIETFSAKGNLRLHYKDGVIKKISLEEFKRLNRGRKW